jgi:hypothetical protein
MADDQALDVVQHPTLGELKFPKDMPFDERNKSIDRLENQSDPNKTLAQVSPEGRTPRPAPIQQPFSERLLGAVTPKPQLGAGNEFSEGGGYTVPGTKIPVGQTMQEAGALSNVAMLGMGDPQMGMARPNLGGMVSDSADAVRAIPDRIGSTLRNPGRINPETGIATRGALKPGLKAASSVFKLAGGPEIADAMIPAHPNPTGYFTRLGSRMPAAPRGLLGAGTPDESPLLIPEPTRMFAGEEPNYMASTPREDLPGLAASGKLGAGTQLQQLGRRILYKPRVVIGQK